MNKKLPLIFLLMSIVTFSQQKENLKLAVFGSVQADVGLDLGSIIRKPQNPEEYYSTTNQHPTYFTYGFTGQVGYQPLNWLALSGGLRYSYISPKFHNVYWMVQPYFFISNPIDREFQYITFNFGRQMNTTQGLSNNGFVGIGAGFYDLVSNHFAQKIQLNLDVQTADDAVWFLGLSYGITIFSNKNL